MYYPVFLIRRAIFVITLVLFANSPKIQIAIMAFSATFMIAYVVIIRPQKDKSMIFLNTFGEFMLLVLHGLQVPLLNPDLSADTLKKLGYLIIGLVGIYIVINWVVVIVVMFRI